MAVIMKIRNRLGVVIVALIMLAIVGFLLQDAFSSNTSIFRNSGNELGSVNGDDVDRQEYDTRVDVAINNMRNQGVVDDQMMGNIRDQVWSQYVTESLMKEKYKKVGIEVSDDELQDQLVGTRPHQYVVRSFSNPQTGQFDPTEVTRFMEKLNTEEEDTATWNNWIKFKQSIIEDRLRVKYNTLIKKAMYVPSWQVNENYALTSATVDFEYVFLPYTEVNDADVTVTDDEIKDYINANKAKYKREESRSIEYVSFDVLPTKDDSSNLKVKLADLALSLKNSKDDSSFLHINSETPLDMHYYGKDELKSAMKDTIFTLKDSNNIIGPYFEDGSFKYAKLVDRKLIPDSVRASHIFFSISTAKSQEDVVRIRAKADSILKVIEAGADFASIAVQYSEDNATKMIGGDWGWIKPGTKFETINDGLFFKYEQGKTFMVGADEPGNAGFHVIKITEAKPTKEAVKVGFLATRIVASSATGDAVYAKADKFASDNKTAEAFRTGSKEYGARPVDGIQKNAYFIPGLGSARDVVKWIYSASINDVSPVFSLEDKHVIVLLTKIQEEGTATIENVRGEVEAEIKKQKKAEKLKEKMKGADLNAIAAATGKQPALAAQLGVSNSNIAGVGEEGKVVGKALGMNAGEFANGIAGDNGVFAIKVNAKNSPPVSDISFQKKQLSQNAESRVEYGLPKAILDAAEVVDNRYKFY